MKILLVLLISFCSFAKTVTNVTFNFIVKDHYSKHLNDFTGQKSIVKSNLFYIVEKNSEFVFNYSDNQYESASEDLFKNLELNKNKIVITENSNSKQFRINKMSDRNFNLSSKNSLKLLEQLLKNKSLSSLDRLGFNLDQDIVKTKIDTSKYACTNNSDQLICEYTAKVKIEIASSDF